MKKIKRSLAVVLTGILVATSLVGCGGKGKKQSNGGNGAQDIEISYWQAGFDIEWLDSIVKAFNEKYPEYNAYYNASASTATVRAAFRLEDTDTVDLYMVTKEYNIEYLEPLNDVLDTTIEGESKSIKEKFDPVYLAGEEKDGNYYNLTYGGGMYGFVYNKKIFEEAGIKQTPRTSDELAVVCSTLSDKGITPLSHFATEGYYDRLEEVWYAQHDGADYYYDIYENPTKEKLLTKDGRYAVLKAQEKINTPKNVLAGSNSETHIAMQTKFLEGESAMMYSGSWLSSEMGNTDKVNDFAMMKTPVISGITSKLTTVKNDSQLRKLVTAIDNVTDGIEPEETYKDGENYKVDDLTISKEDWLHVKSARNSVGGSYHDSCLWIPKYSNAKEGAKEFLRFLYSDEGYKIYLDALHLKMPLELSSGEIDTSKWNMFEQNQAELFDCTENFIEEQTMNKNELYLSGGADIYAKKKYVNKMCTKNEADRESADEVWDYIVKTIEEKYEKTWMSNIK